MSATVKSLIIGGLGLLLALILGAQVGQSSQMIPLIITGGCIGVFICVALFRTVRFEALILGFLLFGYIVGNRGFAQLALRPGSSLYIGEVGMLACAFLVTTRRALTREQLIPRTPLAWAILAFLLIGGVRLYFDAVLINSSDLATTAIRDSAAVYYAIFFFIAYQIGKHLAGRKFVDRALFAAFVLLIPVAAVEIWASGLFDRFAFHGYPIIQHKGDLLTTFLGIGAFYFFLAPSHGLTRIFFWACSLASLILMLFPMSRAALFGFIAAAVLLLIARRPQFILYQVGIAALALFAITLLELADIRIESDLFGKLSDRLASIVDVSGTGHYHAEIGDASAANNQFRTVWWKIVINETMDKNPVFGLGFGYDLSTSFVRTYYSNQQATWDTRSPHSIWVTILGRMGIIGALCFTLIIWLVLKNAIRDARAVARSKADPNLLFNWCAVVTLLCSAMFGVVLEGPMGGILFWSFLGLAASQSISTKEVQKAKSSSVEEAPEPKLPEPAFISRRRSA